MIISQVLHPSQSRVTSSAWLQIFGATLFIALMTQIEIFLPFTPIPITGQTLAVLAIGALLGSQKGALTILLYLTEGLLGLPFFTKGGFGLMHLIGPTGGYLIGFVAQAYIAGWLIERMKSRSSLVLLAALLASTSVQMLFGLLWLSHFVGWGSLLQMGLYPFIPGEVVKAVAVTGYLLKK
jgi:biotin transport system substrate-specific component